MEKPVPRVEPGRLVLELESPVRLPGSFEDPGGMQQEGGVESAQPERLLGINKSLLRPASLIQRPAGDLGRKHGRPVVIRFHRQTHGGVRITVVGLESSHLEIDNRPRLLLEGGDDGDGREDIGRDFATLTPLCHDTSGME